MPFSFRHKLNLLKVLAGYPAPIYVQLALSSDCTLRCRMCNVVDAQAPRLDSTQIEPLADVLHEMGVGFVVLTGGEPLLYHDVVRVVAALCRRGITVRIQSNGMLVEADLLCRLRDAGLDGMTISLHSLSAQTMDELTGRPGSLARVFAALCTYSQVFPPGRYVGGINTVVTRANLEEIPRLIRFATAVGLAIALIPVHFPVHAGSGVRANDAGLAFTRQDAPMLHRIFAEARALKRRGHRVYNTDRFLGECVAFMTDGTVGWKCESPSLYFSISASAILLPCLELPGTHAMVDAGFLPAWKSGAIARQLHERVSACPGCMYPCYPELSYLFHSKLGFARRVLDYCRLSAPAAPITPHRIRTILDQLG